MDEPRNDMSWWDRVVAVSTNRRTGFGLFASTSVGFVILALLAAGPTPWLSELDGSVQDAVFELRSPWLDQTMIWVTRLGSRVVIGALVLVLAVWVVRTGRCRKALAVIVIAFLTNPLLELAIKAMVGRSRPTASQLVSTNGLSFPSGHVLATVGFYGVLAAVVWRSSNRRSLRTGAYAAATAAILLVGFSRLYLGVHWFSDVVGAMLLGTAFVLAVAWALRGHHLGRELGCEVGE